VAHQDVEGEAEAALPAQRELEATLEQPPGAGVEGGPGCRRPLLQRDVVPELCAGTGPGLSARGWGRPGDAGGPSAGAPGPPRDTSVLLPGCSRDAPGMADGRSRGTRGCRCPQHSPISRSRWPWARVPARKQSLARRQTAPEPPRWQFFWMTLMAGGSTVSDALTWTMWRELVARGRRQRDARGDGDLHPGTVPRLSPLLARGN